MQRSDEWARRKRGRGGKKLAEEDSSKVFGEVFGETERVGRKGEDAANGTKKQSEEARGANEE